ncbi:MAG: phosphoribosylanthranilate isomerase [Rhizobiales bacterium]|nr:phosphoribosylanthranilate isomerase [Hyphomicrobiales bacterium]
MPVDVKICGLSTPETMDAALAAGADLVGLVFYPASPRNVSLSQAATLADRARGKARIVTLIVDAGDASVTAINRAVGPDFFQAHGDETPERIEALQALTGKQVIKAIKVKDAADIARASVYAGKAAFILYDAKTPPGALPGGMGVTFDWPLLRNTRGVYMLGGGLTPANVADAVLVTGAAMVDVSSGVESAPGVKDIGLIGKFIEAAKGAS